MNSSEEMATVGKWNLSTASDWELSDHSEIINENIQQSKLVTEPCKQLMSSWMNRNSINFFREIFPEFNCIGAIVPYTNSSIIWWSSNQWFSDSTRKTCNRSRMKSTSQIIKGTFTGFIIETITWVIFASNSISLRILSYLRIFELKKVSLSRILTRDRFSSRNLTRNWTVRILSLSKISCIFHHVRKSSFDDFLSLYKIPPV